MKHPDIDAEPVATTTDAASRNQAWKAARSAGIGASEVLATMHADPYTTAYQLWCRKTTGSDTVPETPAMRHGRLMEPLVADEFAHVTGMDVTPTGTWRHRDHAHHLCSPDRFTSDASGLEIKTTTERHAPSWDAYDSTGQPLGDDEPAVPARAFAQARWCMHVTNLPHWWVACHIYGHRLRIYRIERDHDIEAAYAASVDRFWNDHVLTGVPPASYDPVADTKTASTAWKPEPGAVTSSLELKELADTYRQRLEQRRLNTDAEAQITRRVKEIMASSTHGEWDGETLWTWLPRKDGTRMLKLAENNT